MFAGCARTLASWNTYPSECGGIQHFYEFAMNPFKTSLTVYQIRHDELNYGGVFFVFVWKIRKIVDIT